MLRPQSTLCGINGVLGCKLRCLGLSAIPPFDKSIQVQEVRIGKRGLLERDLFSPSSTDSRASGDSRELPERSAIQVQATHYTERAFWN